MTFEEVKVGDVLYSEEDKVHYLVVDKDDKMIFGRVSSHKATRVNIGNDVLIAPGAFVNFDVPDNSIVIGNPGKIITKNSSPTSKYIVYPTK